jgi:hypothetical protein
MVGLWGGGTVLAYARVLFLRRRSYAIHRDRRARRDYIEAFGLFLTALFSGLSIAFVLLGQSGTGLRSFVITGALGAFLAVGILMASEKPEKDR